MLHLRLPALTPTEKTACLTLICVLGSGFGMRAWERSGVRLGPVHDWDSLHQWVIAARRQDSTAFGCPDPGGWSEHWPQRVSTAAGAKKGTDRSVKKEPSEKTSAEPVDLNSADAQALQNLPGVGPATARAILAYRRKIGPFHRIEDLQRVKGIGPKKLAGFRGMVCVAPDTTSPGKNPAGS